MALNDGDIKKLSTLIDNRLDIRFEKQKKDISKLLVAQDIRNWAKNEKLEQKFEAKVTKLKSDFYNRVDPVLKEVVTAREERLIIVSRLSKHTDQIKALKKIHPRGQHATT